MSSMFILCSLEVTRVVASDTRRPQLLDQDPDHVDEDDEVHLHGNVNHTSVLNVKALSHKIEQSDTTLHNLK